MNWCPGCRTSVSDLEVVAHAGDRARSGRSATTSWTERRAHRSGRRWISVATTRPETILGDTAVAVHPDDARYRDLVGRTVRIPFVERDVPIVADEAVDPAFGTGRREDHARPTTTTTTRPGMRHGLPMITVLDDLARVAGHGHAVRRARSVRGTGADRGRPRGARRPRGRGRRTRWSSAAASAATTSSSRG